MKNSRWPWLALFGLFLIPGLVLNFTAATMEQAWASGVLCGAGMSAWMAYLWPRS